MSSDLRVIITPREYDHRVWVAECLETGFITTGESYTEAREGILKVLRTEALFAQDKGIALSRFPIRAELEDLWKSLTSEHKPEIVELFPAPQRKPPGRVTENRVSVAKSG